MGGAGADPPLNMPIFNKNVHRVQAAERLKLQDTSFYFINFLLKNVTLTSQGHKKVLLKEDPPLPLPNSSELW